MLVLSRNNDQTIKLPTLGVTIRVLKISSNRVRVGIDAPPEVPILRGEILTVSDDVDVNIEADLGQL